MPGQFDEIWLEYVNNIRQYLDTVPTEECPDCRESAKHATTPEFFKSVCARHNDCKQTKDTK